MMIWLTRAHDGDDGDSSLIAAHVAAAGDRGLDSHKSEQPAACCEDSMLGIG
jgi:hypothetical protein